MTAYRAQTWKPQAWLSGSQLITDRHEIDRIDVDIRSMERSDKDRLKGLPQKPFKEVIGKAPSWVGAGSCQRSRALMRDSPTYSPGFGSDPLPRVDQLFYSAGNPTRVAHDRDNNQFRGFYGKDK